MKQRKLGREYLQENVGAVDVGLTSTALRRIDEVAPEDALLENDTPDGRWRWLIADLSTWHHRARRHRLHNFAALILCHIPETKDPALGFRTRQSAFPLPNGTSIKPSHSFTN